MKIDNEKSGYVCGPLTELPKREQEKAKLFYSSIAGICKKILGVRAFVPHEHYDPIKNSDYTPWDVDRAERRQVCKRTSILLVAALAPSWGGGIEVEMANRSKIPIILLLQEKKLEKKKISRLLRGNPGVLYTIVYKNEKNALKQLINVLKDWKKDCNLMEKMGSY